MKRLFLGLGLVLTVAGCTTAGERTDPRRPFASDNPCTGRGERFHMGVPSVSTRFPADATIIRQARRRGTAGVCYTTPASLAASKAGG